MSLVSVHFLMDILSGLIISAQTGTLSGQLVQKNLMVIFTLHGRQVVFFPFARPEEHVQCKAALYRANNHAGH